jgi:hypothetical protein
MLLLITVTCLLTAPAPAASDKAKVQSKTETETKHQALENKLDPRREELGHLQRAVTEDDYKALALENPGIQVQRTEPTKGGKEQEHLAPASTRVTQSLKDRHRAEVGKVDEDNERN